MKININKLIKINELKTLNVIYLITIFSTIYSFSFNNKLMADEDDFTLGWETEFEAGKEAKENSLFSFPHRIANKYAANKEMYAPRIKESKKNKFYFLEEMGMIEQSMNIELRSKVTRGKFDLVFDQMKKTINEIEKNNKKISKELQSDIKGFHLHFRFNKSKVKNLGDDEFRAWVSRIGDYIFAWRANKTRTPYFAFKVLTQTRNAPHATSFRGTIRMVTDDIVDSQEYRGPGKQYDIEIRGYMRDIAKLKSTFLLMYKGIDNPETINGFYNQQSLMFNSPIKLSKKLDEYARSKNITLSPKQKKYIDAIARFSTFKDEWEIEKFFPSNDQVILPLMGYEFAPYFNDAVRSKIKTANTNFFENLLKIINENDDISKIDLNENNFRENNYLKSFRTALKDWSKEIDFEKILEDSLYVNKILDSDKLFQDIDYIKWLIAHSDKHEEKVMKIIKEIPDQNLKQIYEEGQLSSSEMLKFVNLLVRSAKREIYSLVNKKRYFVREKENGDGCFKPEIPNERIDTFLIELKKLAKNSLNASQEKSDVGIEMKDFLDLLAKKKKWNDKNKEEVWKKFKLIDLTNVKDVIKNIHLINKKIETHNSIYPEHKIKTFNKETLSQMIETFNELGKK